MADVNFSQEPRDNPAPVLFPGKADGCAVVPAIAIASPVALGGSILVDVLATMHDVRLLMVTDSPFVQVPVYGDRGVAGVPPPVTASPPPPTSAGPNSPGTIVDDASVGTVAWTNPSNAGSSNDGYAVASSISAFTSHYLWATNFGFAIPAGSTINGITVEIEKSESTTFNDVTDATVKLIKGGAITGNNKADAVTEWGTADAYASYGGAADLWGATLTSTDVNANNFGVAISATVAGGAGGTANVDHVRITINYTPP